MLDSQRRVRRSQVKDGKMLRLIRHDRTAQLAAAVWVLAGVVPLSAPACRAADSTGAPANVLLFNGRGTSSNDVAAVTRSLHDSHLSYSIADSPRLDAMGESELRAYRLLIVPGGNFEQIGNGLKPRTTATLRNAIRHGLNYLGLCAGAFFAGDSPYNGLNLTSGVRFTFYAAESLGVHKAAIPIAIAGSLALDNYWEDGPQLTGWGSVVGRYPDGKPAIVEGRVGNGWAILSGVHPEAPDNWRRGLTFATPAVIDNAYAETLIDAALTGKTLAHY
jgi:hypothetical protein